MSLFLRRLDGSFELTDEVRALWNDAVEVQRGVTREVVHLDVLHVGCLLDAWNLPHVDAVAEDVAVLADLLRVALEVDLVDLVVANEGLEKADV